MVSRWRRLETEGIHPAARTLDRLTAARVVEVMTKDHRRVLTAVGRERGRIARAAAIVSKTITANGRIVFVGAGTSGRLGVIEAAELPPTFGIPQSRAIGIMAGGAGAVGRAREGVEDDAREGARAIRRLHLGPRDVVIGSSASGVTPFVEAALAAARSAGAAVVGITCNPRSSFRRFARPLIVLRTGPEVIAGSTRLKAGTATKIVLNLITTAAMIRAGRTKRGLMMDVRVGSRKLRDRAIRIVASTAGVDEQVAAAMLDRSGGSVREAIQRASRGSRDAAASSRIARTSR